MVPKTYAIPAALLLVGALVPLSTALDAGPVPVATLTLRAGESPVLDAAPGWSCVLLPMEEGATEGIVACEAVADSAFCVDPAVFAEAEGNGLFSATAACGPINATCTTPVVTYGFCSAQASGASAGPFTCRFSPVGVFTWWRITCWQGSW